MTAGPGIGTERVDEPFASSDLPLSVVDYLSLTGAGLHSKLLGRSVFRVQSRSRYVFFGNTRRNALGAIDPEGRLLLCRRRFQHCEAFELPQGVFSSRRRRVPWPGEEGRAEEGGVVAAAASFSLTSGTPAPPLETLELMAGKQIEVDGRPRMLHGGQNVQLAPGEWIEVELSVAAEGVAGVELRHILRDPLRVHLDETRRLPVGHHLELAYAFVPEKPVNKIQCMSMARALADGEGADGEGAGGEGANGGGDGSGASGAGPTTLTFKTARMHLRSSGERPPPGLTILRDDVRPSTGP